ncbi:serine hydrolase domain-containing protein [Salinisphaera sp. W335]|uniref:Serine hydrolase domain-containing protein n=2 Tax=Spectribacter hydrogenoxidans TaxID=3075608 RepID=A0ABU3BZC8_9GAMM|nr:serine hydrolase domain-containing protein [Salinisphaera sp. W335]MDT0634474.1 serine hydrolase domain-containing protein [Salinisphaera sp. W335]
MDNNRLDALLGGAAEAGKVPGVVAMAADADGVTYTGAFGERELGGGDAMTEDTVFLLASMTKAVGATAAMQLVEQGELTLDGAASELLPELAEIRVLDGFEGDQPRLRRPRSTVTLRNLLTHTSGFGYEIWNADLARYQEQKGIPSILSGQRAALRVPLMSDPGTRWEYGTGIDWVGRLVEAASGQRLGDYFREHIFEPLGMTDTAFTMSDDARARLATIHARTPDGRLAPHPLVLEQDPEQQMAGHGLYGTAGDYLRFTRAILNNGELDGQRILQAKTVDLMRQNHIGDLEVPAIESIDPTLSNNVELYPGMSKKWGLSFLINTEETPEGRAAGSVAWAGLANSYYWIDHDKGVTGVYFTQILPFFDPESAPLFQAFEQAVYNGQ